ncbi:MAG: queuosine precursor transporter [Gammaproteobacteria bacterium]|nr:queuosine precursor transporter [Gammaproteobacteria bacterium]
MAIDHKAKVQYKYCTILCMLYLTAMIASITVGYRLISIGHSLESGSVFIFPLTYFFGDIIAEVYGYRVARNLIWISLVCELLFVVLTNVVVLLPYSGPSLYQHAYDRIVPMLFRAYISDLATILISEYCNIYIVTKWKKILHGRYYWLRSLGASSVGSLIYSLVATLISFSGLLSAPRMIDLAFSAFIYKEMFLLVCAAPGALIVLWLKREEKVDVYDQAIGFNPFRFNI